MYYNLNSVYSHRYREKSMRFHGQPMDVRLSSMSFLSENTFLRESQKLSVKFRERRWGVREKIENCQWKSVSVREASVGKTKFVRESPWGVRGEIKVCPWKSVSVLEVSVRKSKIVRESLWASVRCPWDNKNLCVKVRERPEGVREEIKNYPWKSVSAVRCPWENQNFSVNVCELPWGVRRGEIEICT